MKKNNHIHRGAAFSLVQIMIIIAVLGLLAAISIPQVHAADNYVRIATSPATLATTVSTNFASPPVIEVGQQQNVVLQFSFNQSAASTSNVVYTLDRGIDRVTWDTNSPLVFSWASQGTTRCDYMTNINVGAYRFLRLRTMANSTALTTMTNYGVQYSIKPNAP